MDIWNTLLSAWSSAHPSRICGRPSWSPPSFGAPCDLRAMKRPSAAVQVRRGVLRAEHAPSAPRKATGELSVVPKDAFYASTRGAWRGWLKKNFASRSYIWLVFPKKARLRRAVSILCRKRTRQHSFL